MTLYKCMLLARWDGDEVNLGKVEHSRREEFNHMRTHSYVVAL